MRNPGSWMTAACVAGGLCLSTAALAQEAKPASPPKGESVISSVQVTATVTKIDHKTREVTLRASDGQEYEFVADEAVKNLPQVKKNFQFVILAIIVLSVLPGVIEFLRERKRAKAAAAEPAAK